MTEVPPGWGLGAFDDDELAASLANVEGHLTAGGGDRDRLQARREAILAEQDERALIAEMRKAHP